MKRFFLVFLLATVAFSTSYAQKYGHVNFGNLLSEMPETDAADKQLEAYNKELAAEGESMVDKFKKDLADAEAKAQEIAPVELEKLKQQLAQQQQAIQQFQQQMALKIDERRRELLGPIIQRAKDAIKAVGKEQGFKMIFDSSLFNSVLFTEEGTDLLPAVKAKLGI